MTTAARKLLPTFALMIAIVTGLLALQVAPASAAGCGTRTLSKVFSKFGDQGDYFLVGGGDLESGSNGWSYSGGARIVSGNESLGLRSGAGSVQIPAGGTVTSPYFCIGKDEPTIRFAAKASGGANYTSLNATIEIKGSTGSVANVYLGQLGAASYPGWKPSPIYSYAVWTNQSWLYNGNDTVQVRFTFTVGGSGGSWNVDSVFVDPFKGV